MSVDLYLAKTFGIMNFIEITLSGSDVIILENNGKELTKIFFNRIKDKIKDKKINNTQPQVNQTVTHSSVADKLMKWHQMMEQ